jgi:hypothetical protein
MAGRTTPSEWDVFLDTAASVDYLELNSKAQEEASQISTGTYIRVVQRLKGEPLFPSLSRIHIEDFDASVDYLPLLISPVLQSVQLVNVKHGAGVAPGPTVALTALLNDLLEWAPDLHSLTITQVPELPMSLLQIISGLSHLRVLRLSTFSQVQSFEEFRPLSALALSTLSLQFSCSLYTPLPTPVVPSPTFLGVLETLHIAGPVNAISDFLQSIDSQSLGVLSLEILKPKLSSCGKLSCKKATTKKSLKRSSLGEGEEAPTPANEPERLISFICSRWAGRLKGLTIVSSVSLTLDLLNMSNLRSMECLHIEGCSVTNIQPTLNLSPTIWHSLTSLHLPTNIRISYPLLRQIALAGPFLEELAVYIDIDEVPHLNELRTLVHPLRSLCIHQSGGSVEGFASPNHRAENWPHLIAISRFLNALFPSLQSLIATTRDKDHWRGVWRLIQLCHDARADDECREPVPVHEEFTVV